MNEPTQSQYLSAAEDLAVPEELQIELTQPVVELNADGAWVKAWLFVPNELAAEQ